MPMSFDFHGIVNLVSANLQILYFGIFVSFAITEMAFSARRSSGQSGRLVVNFSLFVISGLISLLIPFSVFAAALLNEKYQFGLLQILSVPPIAIFLINLLARTFLSFAMHIAYHKVEWMWQFHKVHHNDPEIDLSTSLRHHPVEMMISVLVISSLVFVLGLPYWSVVLVELLLYFSTFWKHTNIVMPTRITKILGFVFVTPEIHLAHHSSKQEETDSNYGNLLVLWDRLFGTFTDPQSIDHIQPGLGDAEDQTAGNLWHQLVLPLK